MKAELLRLTTACVLCLAPSLRAATTYYVDAQGTNPVPPYADWSTAATSIQDAIDAATNGDLVLVTDGVYASGGRPVNGYALTNRVVLNKALTLQSVHGPAVTLIQGSGPLGDSAVRCAYLADGAVMNGFTLTGGYTRTVGDWYHEQDGGGAWCETTNCVLSNCVFSANAAWDSGGGIARGTLFDCLLTSNYTANVGGGAAGSTLNNCTLAGNSADFFGGGNYGDTSQFFSTLNHCTLRDNYSAYEGGGTYGGTLNYCSLSNNVATDDYYQDGYGVGGGAEDAALNHCVLTGNRARGVNAYGGGADGCNAYSCILYNNFSEAYGGGVSYCDGNNCTITGNSAAYAGGGMEGSGLQNCILYYNTAPLGANYHGSGCSSCDAMDYCNTTPLPPPGVGGGLANITTEPQLVDFAHLAAGSPCLGMGLAAYAVGVDVDDEPWGFTPAIGCDEYHAPITGPLQVAIQASDTTASAGFQVRLVAVIDGHPSASWWDLGEGTGITNRPYLAHTWNTPGDYTVRLTAANNTYPAGVSAAVVVHVTPPSVLYVNAANPNPVAPYASWATAATNIQDAVDAAPAQALVLVTNGVYASGGTVVHGVVTNRLAVNKPVMVRSVNGPAATIIDGGGLMRCVYLTNDALLAGFTLTNGAALAAGDELFDQSGGAAWCESGSASLLNCILCGNTAAQDGGAILGGTLYNAALFANKAGRNGGAAASSVLNNCTVAGNLAAVGGGTWGCELRNSIVYYNSALNLPDYAASTLNFCCTRTLPSDGTFNTTAEPQLADAMHLSASSPCRAAGSPAFATALDIDGEAWGNPPSIGCDEFYAGSVTGPLAVAIVVGSTNVVQGYPVSLTGTIAGHATASRWDFGDGVVVTNQPYASHQWTTPGDYTVVLTAFNTDHPAGVSATQVLHIVEGIAYVDASSANPVAPYASWATAATNIQDAVEAALAGGTVLITNGLYCNGGAAFSGTSNRVTVLKQLTVRSVNGPGSVLIDGGGVMRCAYLTNFATLSGVTLTNGGGGGIAGQSTFAVVSNCVVIGNAGGGAASCTVNASLIASNVAYNAGGLLHCTADHCTIVGNVANGDYGWGGGALASTLNYCTVLGNSATGSVGSAGGVAEGALNSCLVLSNTAPYIGGVDSATINNCTIVGNAAVGHPDSWGGGTGNCAPNNSIVYYNTSPSAPNIGNSSSADHCCTPDLLSGPGNFTNPPAFVNLAAGDFHLQANSPCINSGNNANATTATDLDGHPRIVGGTADAGAYEFQAPQSALSYAWLQQYGLPTDGSADQADSDGDGLNNYAEWKAGTNPTNSLSALRLASPVLTNNPARVVVAWQSQSGITYYLQRSSDLRTAFTTLQSNILGQAGTTVYPDLTATNHVPYFYRVGVQ